MDNIRYEVDLVHVIHWAAGFLEGEGHFSSSGNSITIDVSQVNRELLDKLLYWFGGAISFVPKRKPHIQDQHKWYLIGSEAAELMMTLCVLMSKKRKLEIKKCIQKWKKQRLHRKHNATYCLKGHRLSDLNSTIQPNGSRRCKKCHNEYSRKRQKVARDKYKTTMCQDLTKTRLPPVAVWKEVIR